MKNKRSHSLVSGDNIVLDQGIYIVRASNDFHVVQT